MRSLVQPRVRGLRNAMRRERISRSGRPLSADRGRPLASALRRGERHASARCQHVRVLLLSNHEQHGCVVVASLMQRGLWVRSEAKKKVQRELETFAGPRRPSLNSPLVRLCSAHADHRFTQREDRCDDSEQASKRRAGS